MHICKVGISGTPKANVGAVQSYIRGSLTLRSSGHINGKNMPNIPICDLCKNSTDVAHDAVSKRGTKDTKRTAVST